MLLDNALKNQKGGQCYYVNENRQWREFCERSPKLLFEEGMKGEMVGFMFDSLFVGLWPFVGPLGLVWCFGMVRRTRTCQHIVSVGRGELPR